MKDILATIGVGIMTFGFYLAWSPLGYIAAGIFVLALANEQSKKDQNDSQRNKKSDS